MTIRVISVDAAPQGAETLLLMAICRDNALHALVKANGEALHLTGRGAKEVMTPALRRWCRERPGVSISAKEMQMWGLTELSMDEEVRDDPSDKDYLGWEVKHVKLGEFQDLNGDLAPCFFGTSANSANEPAAEFYPILFYTLMTARMSLDAVFKRCLKHKGKPVRISVGGCRPEKDGKDYLKFVDEAVLFSTAQGFPENRCLAGAIANSITVLLGRDDAETAMALGMANQTWRDALDASKWIAREVGCVSLDKVRDEDGRIVAPTFEWLCDLRDIVVIVELVGDGGFRHAICVDGVRSKIFDISEKHVLIQCRESLEWCFGDDHTNMKSENMRRVRDKSPGKKMRKRKRSND